MKARSSRRRGSAGVDERRFHAWLARTARAGPSELLPLGDDVAARSVRSGTLLLTSDAFVETVHFRPVDPPRAVGRALVEANLSDLAAKGGRPVAFLLDLLVPVGSPERWARAVVDGARAALRPHGITVSGGDTKPSTTRCAVGTAVGWTRATRLPARSGARAGDRLVVTGAVGGGAAAYVRLAHAGARPVPSALSLHARVPEGQALAPLASAMIDTSDGLFESAHLLAEASRVALVLARDDVPIAPTLRRLAGSAERAWELAGFGGDYELLAAIPPSRLARARRALARLRTPLTEVGRVEPGHGAWWRQGDRRRPLARAGWDPFGGARPPAAR